MTAPADLDPATAALLVVDVSRDFLAPGAPMRAKAADTMLARLPGLLSACREVGLPVVYVNHVHQAHGLDLGTLGERFPVLVEGRALRAGTPGVEIWPDLAPEPGDVVVEKIRQSGFTYSTLEAVLRGLGATTLLIGGLATAACVESTARDAVSRDFDVVLLSDGTASSALPDVGFGAFDADTVQRVCLSNFAHHFGRVASVAEVVAALERHRATALTPGP